MFSGQYGKWSVEEGTGFMDRNRSIDSKSVVQICQHRAFTIDGAMSGKFEGDYMISDLSIFEGWKYPICCSNGKM